MNSSNELTSVGNSCCQTVSEKCLKQTYTLIPDWQKYALALYLPNTEIENIKGDSCKATLKMCATLLAWHRRYSFKATYSHLVQVCLDQGDATVAEAIERSILTPILLIVDLIDSKFFGHAYSSVHYSEQDNDIMMAFSFVSELLTSSEQSTPEAEYGPCERVGIANVCTLSYRSL